MATSARSPPSGRISLAPTSAIRAIGRHRAEKLSSRESFTASGAIGKPLTGRHDGTKRHNRTPIPRPPRCGKIWPERSGESRLGKAGDRTGRAGGQQEQQKKK